MVDLNRESQVQKIIDRRFKRNLTISLGGFIPVAIGAAVLYFNPIQAPEPLSQVNFSDMLNARLPYYLLMLAGLGTTCTGVTLHIIDTDDNPKIDS